MGGMTLGKSPEQMMREREAINASRVEPVGGKYAADIQRALRMGEERGLGPAVAAQRLRQARMRGEMIPEPTFGEDEEADSQPLPKVKNYAKGGKVSSASSRADGCARKGHTKGKML